MIHAIRGLFDAPTLGAVREAAAALEFEDGARTAGRIARQVKANAQAAPSEAREALLRKVEAVLLANPVFRSAALPRGFARTMVSRYRPGQAYGLHVDDALIGGARADLSFTLFLSDPDTYDGGALVISDRIEDRAVRLPAGECVLYPSDTLHRVDPVTRGERLAIVGWVTSRVRDPARREILFDLDQAMAALGDDGPQDARLGLARARSNLIRMWAD